MTETPDAALLWARERVAADLLPSWAARVMAGEDDNHPDLVRCAEGYRAGHAAAQAEAAERVAALQKALQRLLDGETVAVHIGYDHQQNYIYGDAILLNDERIAEARAALGKAQP